MMVFGGKEPRFTLNTVINSISDAYQLISEHHFRIQRHGLLVWLSIWLHVRHANSADHALQRLKRC